MKGIFHRLEPVAAGEMLCPFSRKRLETADTVLGTWAGAASCWAALWAGIVGSWGAAGQAEEEATCAGLYVVCWNAVLSAGRPCE